MRNREQMQHGIRGTAGRDHDGDRVLESFACKNLTRRDAFLQKIHRGLAGVDANLRARFRHCWDIRAAWNGHAQGLDSGSHGVCRVHTGARTRAGTRHSLELPQRFGGHLLLRIGAYRLEHVLNGHIPIREMTGHDRAAIQEHGGKIQTSQTHEHPGETLVASGDRDEPVKTLGERDKLNGIGNHFAAHERSLHAFMTHGDRVTHSDRAKLDGCPRCGAHAFLDYRCQPVQMNVARSNFVP